MSHLNVGGAGHTRGVSNKQPSRSENVNHELQIKNDHEAKALKKEVGELNNELNKVFPK